jgi:serine-type D-Ala-D-Ala endopeptidase (penicillin-binding protein 7)
MHRIIVPSLALVACALMAFSTVRIVLEAWHEDPRPYPLVSVEAPWAPPEWLPHDAEAAWVLPELDQSARFTKGPRVYSKSAIIADLDRGEVLWTRAPDERRSVASLTKMVAALSAKSLHTNFGKSVCVSPEQWPSMRGARSKFETGVCHDGWDFLGAALVKSDNRGAMGLAAVAGVSLEDFLGTMAEVSRELRLSDPEWTDPTGLEDENMASARDMLKAVVAMSALSDLSLVSSAPEWQIERKKGPQWLSTTNRTIRDNWETHAAKTGYTSTAGYCFATVVTTKSGRRFAVAVLGAPRERNRFADARALVKWAESATTG